MATKMHRKCLAGALQGKLYIMADLVPNGCAKDFKVAVAQSPHKYLFKVHASPHGYVQDVGIKGNA